MKRDKMRILMVCLGNICRSPLAEGILRYQLEEKGIFDIEVDSCGFEAYHLNDSPDKRSVEVGLKYGIDIRSQRQRLFKYEDFEKFDKIYVMDSNNYSDIASMALTKNDLKNVDFITNILYPNQNKAVPDPYYGGKDGFEKVYKMLDECCKAIIENFKKGKLIVE